MQIDSSFSLTDIAISAMRNLSKRMLSDVLDVENAKANVYDLKGAESDMGAEAGVGSSGHIINLDNLPVRMTNLNIAAQTYGATVGLLDRYQQMTEIKLELMG